MKVISLVSRKGGSGKTTIAGHLGVALPGKVAFMDTDPQGSLSSWWNDRQAETPGFVRVTPQKLPARIAQLAKGEFDYMVIDTPPDLGRALGAAIEVSDLVLVPIRPSPHDLRAVGATVDMVKAEKKRLAFIINNAIFNSRLTAEAIAVLKGNKVCPVVIHQRSIYAASMVDGRTAQELSPSSKAAKEIAALRDYVITALRR